MKRLNKKVLWILIGVLLILAIGLILLCSQTSGAWTKMVIVLIAGDFIALTILIQVASYQTFRYKPKMNTYPQQNFIGEYEGIKQNLLKEKYKERQLSYGSSFLKVVGDTALKCTLIEIPENYFNMVEESYEKEEHKKSELDQCKKFIGIELFKEIDEDNLKKLPDYTLQGKNIYYTAFLYQDNSLWKCLNYLEPNEDFKDGFSILLNDLNIKMETETEEKNEA